MAYVKGQPFIPQFTDPATGLLMTSGTIEFYLTGTSTPTPYYTDSTGTSGGTSLTLNSGGKPPTDIYYDTGITYKIVVKDAAGTTLDTIDPYIKAAETTVTNVAAIQSSNLSGVEQVTTKGYYAAGDQGGAQYYADTADTTTADDGFLCIVSNDGVRFKLIYTNTIKVRWTGAKADDSTDNRAKIQAAIDHCSTNKIALDLQDGIYQMTKGGAQTAAPIDPAYPCLELKSNLHIFSDSKATLKVADSQSSDLDDYNVPILFSTGQLENITVRGVVFDSNVDNNSINELAHTWMQIGFSSQLSDPAAHANDVLIEDCVFKNNPGVTNIGMGQNERTTGDVGARWTVRNCYFYNNGYKSHDHSSIYAYADDVIVEGCVFDNPDMFGTQQLGGTDVGGQVAYEMHGARQVFTNNIIKNYDQVAWIATNKIAESTECIFSDNISYTRDTGYAVYRESAPETAIYNMNIVDNIIELSDDSTAVGLKACVRVTSNYGVSDFNISNNIAYKTGTNESGAFFTCGPQSVANETHTRMTIDNNYIKGMCFGAYIATTTTNGLGDFTFSNNRCFDFDATTAFSETAGFAVNIVGSNTVDSLTITNNSFIDSAGTGDFDRGVFISGGAVKDLHLEGNSYIGMAIAKFTENGSLVESGTATSGSTTTLDDTGATFVTNGGAVGDILINETNSDHGTVSAITETTLTISEGMYGGTTNAASDTYKLVKGGLGIDKTGTYPTKSYTPTWSLGGTAITLGNGTVDGYYNKIGDLCYVTAELIVGSTTTLGSGTVSVSLPFAAQTAGVKYFGQCLVIDGGATRYQGQAVIDGTGTTATFERDSGTFFTDTSPITLANTDELYITIMYRIAD